MATSDLVLTEGELAKLPEGGIRQTTLHNRRMR
jgi:hypothetical protein